jgi:hypothetical protein
MVDVFVFSDEPTELEPSVRITGVVYIQFEFTCLSSKRRRVVFLYSSISSASKGS